MRWQKSNVLTMFVETEGSWRVPYALARGRAERAIAMGWVAPQAEN